MNERSADKWDAIAPTYTDRYVDVATMVSRQVDLVCDWGVPMPAGSRVLEVGCADGCLTEALARRGFAVTGIDVSAGMVEQAQLRFREAGLEATFAVADLNEYESATAF